MKPGKYFIEGSPPKSPPSAIRRLRKAGYKVRSRQYAPAHKPAGQAHRIFRVRYFWSRFAVVSGKKPPMDYIAFCLCIRRASRRKHRLHKETPAASKTHVKIGECFACSGRYIYMGESPHAPLL